MCVCVRTYIFVCILYILYAEVIFVYHVYYLYIIYIRCIEYILNIPLSIFIMSYALYGIYIIHDI